MSSHETTALSVLPDVPDDVQIGDDDFTVDDHKTEVRIMDDRFLYSNYVWWCGRNNDDDDLIGDDDDWCYIDIMLGLLCGSSS